MTDTLTTYWDRAMTYGQYLDQMTRRRDDYELNVCATDLSNVDLSALKSRSLRFLIITEDWCIDSAQFVPPLVRYCQETGDAQIRFLLRPDVPELADNYRNATGRQPIPVIIVMDEHGSELGALLERPTRVSQEMADETRRFASENQQLEGIRRTYANMPDETRAAVSANSRRWRATQLPQFTAYLFDELSAIVRAGVQA